MNNMIHSFLYILALVSLSQSPNIVRLSEAPVNVFGYWRLLIAGLLIIPFAFKYGNLLFIIKTKPQKLLACGLTGVLFYAHLGTFFYAAKNTSIANGMIIYATNPLFTALGAYFFFKEKFTHRLYLAYILAITGIFYLVQSHLNFNALHLKGDLAALISAFLFAGYILSGKKVRSEFSNLSFSVIIYLSAAFCFGITGVLQNQNFTDYPTPTWLAIIASITIPTFLGHSLFSYLMKYMNINLMSFGKIVEPIISSTVAYFLFSETINKNTLISFGLVTAAVGILLFPTKNKTQIIKTAPEDI